MAASIDLSDLEVAREQYPLVCEVARHGGGTLDFDIILDLRRVTGIPDLNYEMYAYIDGKFDDDLLQICEDILDGTDNRIPVPHPILYSSGAALRIEGTADGPEPDPQRRAAHHRMDQ